MAIEFAGNGSGEHIKLGKLDLSSGLTSLTICCWVKFNNFNTGDQRMFSKATSHNEQDHFFMFSGLNNSQVRFRLKTGGTVTTHIEDSATINTGQWYHWAIVYTGSNVIFYRNGQENGTTSKGGTIDTSASIDTWLADNPGTHRKELNGSLKDVRLYERDLDPGEALTIATLQGGDSIFTGLKHRWLLNEGSEGQTASGTDSVIDIMGNQHGTPASTPVYQPSELLSTRRIA